MRTEYNEKHTVRKAVEKPGNNLEYLMNFTTKKLLTVLLFSELYGDVVIQF